MFPDHPPPANLPPVIAWTLWGLYQFTFHLAAIVAVGAVAGALLFSLGEILFDFEGPFAYRISRGVLDGAFLAFVWAPGAAIVILTAKIHQQRKRRRIEGNRSR